MLSSEMVWVIDVQLRVDGDVGLTDDDCESRLSKLVPYGLLSSSFHILTTCRGQSRQVLRKEVFNTIQGGLFRAFKPGAWTGAGRLRVKDESFKRKVDRS